MASLGGDEDPLDLWISQAFAAGWSMVPQVTHGSCDNALLRVYRGITDVVTIPLLGYSTMVRLQGGPLPGQPRRTGVEQWRRHMPVDQAVAWLLNEPADDGHPNGG